MKKFHLILILLVLTPLMGYSQYKLSYGGNVNYGLNTIDVNLSQLWTGIRNNSGIAPGYSVGLDVRLDIDKTVFFRTGVQYIRSNYRHELEGIDFAQAGPFARPSSIRDEISLSSIGIPIEMGFVLKKGKKDQSYYLGFGGTLHIPLKTQIETVIFNETAEEEAFRNDYYTVKQSIFTPQVFVGMEIQLSDKMRLGMEPFVRFPGNEFMLYFQEVEVQSGFEAGITLRLRMN